MRQLRPVPPRPQFSKSHCSSALLTCKFVFVRNDTGKKPLQSPYDGPFKLLKRHEKHFSLEVNGKSTTIGLDRIKAAQIDSPTTAASCTDTAKVSSDLNLHSNTSPLDPRSTRIGRKVNFPHCFGS